jgi:hypothetical protein
MAGTRSRRESSASTQASMRSVLQARGARPLAFWASASATSQPWRSSVSWTKRAVHRLDRRPDRDRTVIAPQLAGQARQPVGVQRGGAGADALAALIEQAVVQTPAAEIQTSMQHHVRGPPPARSFGGTPERGTEEARLHDIQSEAIRW